jgi:non-ribosomal peptide synthase protein (TIGR01720 family)
LAGVAGKGPTIVSEQGIVEGPVPLTPIQRWFFEQEFAEPDHWNQSVMLEVRDPLRGEWVERVVGHLLEHHDALRLRFRRVGNAWEQHNAGLSLEIPFSWVDLSGVRLEERVGIIGQTAAEIQASLNLSEGPLLRVVYFDLGGGHSDRLLMVVHHLAIDGVSWRILLEDLQTVYQQLTEGKPLQLPPKTTSFRQWAKRLLGYSQTDRLQVDWSYWLASTRNVVSHLPLDFPDGENTEVSERWVTRTLTEAETQALLREVPASYGTEINDVLLTALVKSLTRWIGIARVSVDLEGHGREDLIEDVNISRTVGWFTSVYPAVLDLGRADGIGDELKTVKEQLRQVPSRGIGYGLLRYLRDDERMKTSLIRVPSAQVSFNYMGQFDQLLVETSIYRPTVESYGLERSPKGNRTHLLDIRGNILHGKLQLDWFYSENLHRPSTIRNLANNYIDALREIIEHCRSAEAGDYTPSDFPDVELSQGEIEALRMEIWETTSSH